MNWRNILKRKTKPTNNIKVVDVIATELLSDNEGKVVALVGPWGSGKTWRWREHILPVLLNNCKQAIYISLFGKNCVADIRKELLDKLVRLTKFSVFRDLILTFVLCGIIYTSINEISKLCLPGLSSGYVFVSSLFVSACLFTKYHSHLVKFLALKILGVDHMNMDWKLIAKKQKLIICFDDCERLGVETELTACMGLFEELKRCGFSLLLIKNDSFEEEAWSKFKEKTLTIQYTHSWGEVLSSVLDRYPELNIIEKEYIQHVHQSLSNAIFELDQYEEQYHDKIKALSANFRFIVKIVNAIQDTKKQIDNFDKQPSWIQEQIMAYTAAVILLTEVGISDAQMRSMGGSNDSNDYNDMFYFTSQDVKSKKYHIGRLIAPKNVEKIICNYPEIKRYLQTKECDKELLNRQIGIIPSDDEKDILEMSHWLDYKTTTQKQLVTKIENILQKPSFKFSTLKNMADFCRNYAVLCTYINKTLNNNNSKNLLTKIEQYINSHDDTYRFDFPEYGIVLYSQTPDKNSEFQANAKFVNNAFETLVLKKLLKDAREEKNFLHILIQLLSIPEYENAISREVYLFVLFSDITRQKELFDMKHSQSSYNQYLQTVKLLLVHKSNALHCVQQLCAITKKNDNIQEAFYERLIEDIKSLKTLPGAGLSEVYTVKNILHE